ncbi:MAG TPA: flagellar protein FlaG [Telluria sp.]|nr:flagellar protein FlaG [Telluria sp.]
MQMQPIANVATREMTDPDRTAAVAAASAPKPAVVADPARSENADPDPVTLGKAVDRLNDTMRAKAQGLEFMIDDDSKRLVVKVVDQQTKEVIRQVPSQEVLEIAKALDRAQGLLIRQQA